MTDTARDDADDAHETSNETETAVFDPADELMIVLLTQGRTHSEIAEQLDMSTKTIQRRLKDPGFAAEVTSRRRAAAHATTARLEQMCPDALDTLSRLLSSADDRVALRAVQLTLQTGHMFHREELVEDEVAKRLSALEELMDQTSGGWK